MSLLLLKSYKEKIESALDKEFLFSNPLQRAMRYALLSGGKRIRPILTLMVADALKHQLPVLQSALAVEFSHTASIIADDLPCMDDELKRRGRSCAHVEFGQATALLASYALITAAYEKLVQNGQEMKDCGGKFANEAVCLAVALSSKASGCFGTTLGQQLDLFEKPDNIEAMNQLIYLKTVTLFEMAMQLGWIFGGGELERVEEVKSASYHLGMAFQIRDDLLDHVEDEARGCMSNFSVLVGKEEAMKRFFLETATFREKIAALDLYNDSFEVLLEALETSI